MATLLTKVAIDSLQNQSIESIHSSNKSLQSNINNWIETQNQTLDATAKLIESAKRRYDNLSDSNYILEDVKDNLQLRNIALVDRNGKALLAGNPDRVGADLWGFELHQRSSKITRYDNHF